MTGKDDVQSQQQEPLSYIKGCLAAIRSFPEVAVNIVMHLKRLLHLDLGSRGK